MCAFRSRSTRIAGLLTAVSVISAGLVTADPAHAVTGPEAAADRFASVVKLTVGAEGTLRSCTATLVDERWIATAASCFAATPGEPVPAGKPALKATVTFSTGQVVDIVHLEPRSDRDLVLARLGIRVSGTAGIKPATTAPPVATDLTAAGFGRTKTEWVPDKPHTGTFTLNSVDTMTLAITGKGTDALCKGDTGGPLLNTAGELVGVNSRSWQGGCLGAPTTETRTGAISARIDNLGAWVKDTVRRFAVQRDLNGDGRSDTAMVYHHADSSIGFFTALSEPSGSFGPYTSGYTVPPNSWDWNAMKLINGDFNGDSRSDIGMMYRFTDGAIKMFTGLADTAGHIQPFTSSYSIPASAGWDWNAIQLYAGDANGDGRSDAIMTYHHADSAISFFTSLSEPSGSFGAFTSGYKVPPNSWDWDAMKLMAGDFNGDGRTDMGMMYRFADGAIKMFTGLADAAGHIQPFTNSYSVPASAGWDWNAIR
ncbi:trypsin-like serine protease, partial [Streptomyces melanogenes]|uniref:trypsin-like serine protease n=1 Tax=Streptomyces melanogenes TaxID=67326 RepID=UPI0037B891B2